MNNSECFLTDGSDGCPLLFFPEALRALALVKKIQAGSEENRVGGKKPIAVVQRGYGYLSHELTVLAYSQLSSVSPVLRTTSICSTHAHSCYYLQNHQFVIGALSL